MLYIETLRGLKPACKHVDFAAEGRFSIPVGSIEKAVGGDTFGSLHRFRYSGGGNRYEFKAVLLGINSDSAEMRVSGEVHDVSPITEEFRKQCIEAQEC